MKKGQLLLLLLLLFQFGCSGGGSGTAANGDNSGGSGGGTDVTSVASMGNITVSLPPVTTAARGLVGGVAGLTRNAARLVVRQVVTQTQTIPVTTTVCDEEDTDWCWQEPVLDGNGDPVTTTNEVTTEVFRKISDGVLDGGGAGSVSITVPSGSGYTLELLTYRTGAYPANPNVNLLKGYGKSEPFAITAGENTTVTITLADVFADLDYPAEVDGGEEYAVSITTKSAALVDTWKVMQSQTPLTQTTTTSWLITDSADTTVVSGQGAITLQAPEWTGSTDNLLWHYGQFFINNNLLKAGEINTNWIFGASSYNIMHPLGTITVIIN